MFELFACLNCLQWETNCSTLTIQKFLDSLRDGKLGNIVRKGTKLPKSVTSADKKMQSMAGAKSVRLHGCVGQGCNKVWGPGDPSTSCNLCGYNRFDDHGKPHEYIVWFPLMDQFKSLLKCKQFEHAVRWEERRKANPNYMCGKYLHAT